ncbi:MAG TPA: AIR synthase related protein, partial [Candidatus Dormibacteraeota bacterium]
MSDDLIVGPETNDDAAVYRLTPELAIVVTADFITPVVDDALDFGAIAATNALSDIYAMGGEPLIALNLVGFPRDSLELSVLEEILSAG